jgi:hypothetical protein
MLTAYHQKLGHPWVFDLENDPRELWNINGPNQWLGEVGGRIIGGYYLSTRRFPNIPPGADGPPAPRQ